MTLPEFLLARIDEEQAEPLRVLGAAQYIGGRWIFAAHGPVAERRFIEADAKRQIVELHGEKSGIPGRYTLQCWVCATEYPCATLRLLALPYDDHPDYHPGWRPE